MKIKVRELFNDYDVDKLHHNIKGTIKRYADKDCIIAYKKSFMGMIGIIKGQQRIFSFIVYNNELSMTFYAWITGKQIPTKTAFKLLNNNCMILNKKEWKEMEREFILENLSN